MNATGFVSSPQRLVEDVRGRLSRMSLTPAGAVSAVLGCILAGFHLFTAWDGTYYPFTQRAFPLVVGMALVFLAVPASGMSGGFRAVDARVPWHDWLLAAACLPAFGYIAFSPDYLADRWPMTSMFTPTLTEQVLGCLAVLLILEATRRLTGWVLVIGVSVVLAYAWLGEFLPDGTIAHRGFSFLQILDFMYLTVDGIWGSALGVAATYIVVFIIFGAFMERAGAADFFVELVTALAGHTRGGPGKVGIFSSALVGSVTGSSVANVYTTGQFTIPMMARLGYRRSTAAAIEALASNGGQLMPPVLGAAAFIVAAEAGVPYQTIIVASILPAALYFLSLLWFIHLEAVRTGMKGLPAAERPHLLPVLKRRGLLLLPLVGLVVLLMTGMSPLRTAFFAVVLTIAVSWMRKETRLGPVEIFEALQLGARNSLMILATCAAVGLIIGTFTLTGLALNASSAIIQLAGGVDLLVLVCIVLACLVLGMGMNTVAAFLLVSVIGVPALMETGMDRLTANMFVFYAALLSHITPPVCLAVFAAAQIAGAGIWRTAGTAMKMGVVAYLMPFLIAGSPSLLLGTANVFHLVPVLAAFAGSLLIASAAQGWMFTRIGLTERVLFGLGGVLLIIPEPNVRLAGLLLVLAGGAIGLVSRRDAVLAALARIRS
ncbi:MAG: TRAP transporter fused permease subunit [Pseudomonadota bacterium]|nr:TRAP transporter fused permease subunit [Pseudomonadota bacterium]